MKKVSIIGCGALGTIITTCLCEHLKDKVEVVFVCDNNAENLDKFLANFENIKFNVVDNYVKAIEQADFIIESASAAIACDVAKRALTLGKDILILSVGGLIDCYDEILEIVQKPESGTLYLPSGAVCGIDGLVSAGSFDVVTVDTVELTTKKNPKGLQGAPYLVENNISLENIEDEMVVFEGTAREAVAGFPKNINVSACLSFAGIGFDRTKVKIIASEKYSNNIHEVYIKGDFGEIRTITSNMPCPLNPKTSYLAGLSTCALVKKIFSKIKIGT